MSRHPAQKFAFAVALLCYLGAAGCLVAAFLYEGDGQGDPVRASLMAAVVFFVGCGVVLQVIGTARLRGRLSGSSDNPHDD